MESGLIIGISSQVTLTSQGISYLSQPKASLVFLSSKTGIENAFKSLVAKKEHYHSGAGAG